mmetsp:Transcript_5010/g.9743  ORF Transcript_5010/g.9743 Transcript_5010/m.9743 type:complete len:193 (-) Transcript_5010:78-656(-)
MLPAATTLLVGAQAFAPAFGQFFPARPSGPTARADTAISLERIRNDLHKDDWQPLKTDPTWRNPCLLTSLITAVSIQQSVVAGAWPLFGLGPLLVLLSSIIYWVNPRRDTWRRTLDLVVVRGGMASHVCIGIRFCRPRGVLLLLAGYAAGGICYAVGRVLTVRGHRLSGAWVHSGVHLFANMGNLSLLRYLW